jgi:tetratricopeptide (TPR) repeat protein
MSIKEDTDEYRKSLLEKARILMKIENCNEAAPLYEKLANSKNIDRDLLEKTYLFMGDFYLMKKYDEAIASYKKSIELDSTDSK